ncbi:MAG: 50S ribosome-binding GTPase [Bacteroidales bacterium]|nr:50S ribosome-binding GTPase [Bacteroidales bacterium]
MERLHIAFFGPANSGKSTLVNTLAGQEVSLVSPIPGTTTDPVRKAIEIPGLGPCVLIDTAGYDDESPLGAQRRRLSLAVLDEADIAVVLGDSPLFQSLDIPVIRYAQGEGIGSLIARIAAAAPEREERSLTGNLLKEGDTVVLVMPQDSEAPKGRLILPQVQVLRELLDRGCNALCCQPSGLQAALDRLRERPALVITDSQAFRQVDTLLPRECPLTSFSILLACAKGDIQTFLEGAGAIDRLQPGDRVLIAEACTHVPDTEDIGRVKIPALLRRHVCSGKGGDLGVDISAGNDFPEDLSPYRLVIHCGACVAGSRLVRARTRKALRAGVPITNYGLALAALQGILKRVAIPRIPR